MDANDIPVYWNFETDMVGSNVIPEENREAPEILEGSGRENMDDVPQTGDGNSKEALSLDLCTLPAFGEYTKKEI